MAGFLWGEVGDGRIVRSYAIDQKSVPQDSPLHSIEEGAIEEYMTLVSGELQRILDATNQLSVEERSPEILVKSASFFDKLDQDLTSRVPVGTRTPHLVVRTDDGAIHKIGDWMRLLADKCKALTAAYIEENRGGPTLGAESWTNTNRVLVSSYFRSDGTYVHPHFRTAPNQYKWDNLRR